VITNIGFDHQDLLGNTLPLIAAEKAGIIKHNTPVVISQSQRDTELVFRAKARHEHAPIYFASDNWKIEAWSDEKARICHQRSRELYSFIPALKGNYQQHNAVGVLETIHQLRALGFNIEKDAIIKGLEKVTINTGLEGRWQILQEKPLVVADTAHNALGLSHVFAQAEAKTNGGRLFILFGVVGDKDLQKVYELLPKHAAYTFCEPSTFRKMPADQLSREIWEATGIAGVVTQDVNRALADTLSRSAPQDVILITGSTFLVADLEKNITN
jgi:dihydrofolate synthase/folylpolyglutamate synthase